MAKWWQWHGHDLKIGDPDWVAENTEPVVLIGWAGPATVGITVNTPRGSVRAKEGDWIYQDDEGGVWVAPPQLVLNQARITRVEVIDNMKGRVFQWHRSWPSEPMPRECELSIQDDGQTLKVFIRPSIQNVYQKRWDEDNGDVMTVDEFRGAVDSGGFIDYDGHGKPMKDGLEDHGWYVFPSRIDAEFPEEGSIPPDATHIAWYNR